ncbi:hypothetical protein GNI_055410 [Gregarina niphandrodes]|uniref:Uncharacterized protein n=1 Tax=Gregarina niphandrodes TaxID=110365 RepID=A0A023B8Z6_GRENI|nr:hypothetical protein GNI_055410 [Gregarina niphandrodes]EZG70506.1 hypothetical protein GNI_055410 [Gregarina niphandrodes]|eukprot:XP_011129926.1 hypothetical protein GNI_055410 [Gregarina niphandrodes]
MLETAMQSDPYVERNSRLVTFRQDVLRSQSRIRVRHHYPTSRIHQPGLQSPKVAPKVLHIPTFHHQIRLRHNKHLKLLNTKRK